jgi:hypothetical protein
LFLPSSALIEQRNGEPPGLRFSSKVAKRKTSLFTSRDSSVLLSSICTRIDSHLDGEKNVGVSDPKRNNLSRDKRK